MRFGRRTRILGGTLLAFGGILNMGLFLKVGSQFVVGVTGIDPTGGLLPAGHDTADRPDPLLYDPGRHGFRGYRGLHPVHGSLDGADLGGRSELK